MNETTKAYFAGRRLVIATKHGKEQLIGPLVVEALGVEIVVPDALDTDQFGTFSGEIERLDDPVEAARKKCRLAAEQFKCTLAIASEGSFGPHPTLLFVPADDEILVFMDFEYDLEIKARVISTNTNFTGDLFTTWKQAESFAKKVSFPEHGLIARNDKESTNDLVKGITTWEELERHANYFLEKYGRVFLETDMRAMHNPTRMKVIAEATHKLLNIILSLCPNCQTPGFDVQDVMPGLPCAQCGSATRSTLAYVYRCKKCNQEEQKLYAHGKESENPMYCDYCNP